MLTSSRVQNFIAMAQANAREKAIQMAKLELSVWNANHENGLINEFGFNIKSVAERKKELEKKVATESGVSHA